MDATSEILVEQPVLLNSNQGTLGEAGDTVSYKETLETTAEESGDIILNVRCEDANGVPSSPNPDLTVNVEIQSSDVALNDPNPVYASTSEPASQENVDSNKENHLTSGDNLRTTVISVRPVGKNTERAYPKEKSRFTRPSGKFARFRSGIDGRNNINSNAGSSVAENISDNLDFETRLAHNCKLAPGRNYTNYVSDRPSERVYQRFIRSTRREKTLASNSTEIPDSQLDDQNTSLKEQSNNVASELHSVRRNREFTRSEGRRRGMDKRISGNIENEVQPSLIEGENTVKGQLHKPRQNRFNSFRGRSFDYDGLRILLVTHVQGRFTLLDRMAKTIGADLVINSGNFGFFDEESYDSMPPRKLFFLLRKSYKYKLTQEERTAFYNFSVDACRRELKRRLLFSELPLLLSGESALSVPIYTIWGENEDVRVLEKFRTGKYNVRNLFILDEKHSYRIQNVRLFGLGGAFRLHKLFDNGIGKHTIAGDIGTMWTTLIQIAELLTTSRRLPYDPTEVRIFVSYTGSITQPMVTQLTLQLRAALAVRGQLRSRALTMYSDASMYDTESWLAKCQAMQDEIFDYWEKLEPQICEICTEKEIAAFKRVLLLIKKIPNLKVMRTIYNINPPYLNAGRAVLTLSRDNFQLETVTNSFLPRVDYRTRNFQNASRVYRQSRRREMPENTADLVDGRLPNNVEESTGQILNR